MINKIKENYKLLSIVNDKNDRDELLIEIYSLILGYFSSKKDANIEEFKEQNIIDDLSYKIKNILKSDFIYMGEITTMLNIFRNFIKSSQNYDNRYLCVLSSGSFLDGYINYIYNIHNTKNIENKLIKILNKK